jgi:hypothetical protein
VSRDRGQITRLQALAGLVSVIALVTGMVRLMDVLLPPQNPATVRLAEELAQRRRGTALEEPQPGVPQCPAPADAPSQVSTTLLYECPRLYDGQQVVYTGEVVGEVLLRDAYAWVQLNDDAYATSLGPLPSHGVAAGGNSGIGVAIPLEAARAIENVGGHERLGDRLTVRGVYHRTDAADGGGTNIRATDVLAISRGEVREAQRHPGRRILALVLLTVTLIVVPLAFRRELSRTLATLGWFAGLRARFGRSVSTRR